MLWRNTLNFSIDLNKKEVFERYQSLQWWFEKVNGNIRNVLKNQQKN